LLIAPAYSRALLFFFQAEDGIRDRNVTGVQTCALPIFPGDNATIMGKVVSVPLDFADDGYDLAHNRCIIPRDRGESLIVRKQPYAAAVVMEFLNGGFFVIQQRSNKIARFGSGLGTYDYPVAIQNGSVLHGLTYDLEHIELALAHDVIGERVIGVYVFFRGN